MDTAEAVLEKHTAWLMSLPGVVGTALGERDGAPAIVVYVDVKAAGEAVPAEIDGYPVSVQATGGFRALSTES